MKRVLLSTTAIVAAGLLATNVAYAEEHETMAEDEMMEEAMMAEEPVSVSLGGSARATMSISSDDSSPTVWEHLEPVISGSATMDNGLTFGVLAFIDASGSWFDAGLAYDRRISVSGAFGSIDVGAIRSARGAMRIASSGATSSFGVNGPYTSGVAKAVSTNDPGVGGNRDTKIVYMSPDIGGIRVGVSYAPDGAVSEQIAAAATFTQDLGDAGVSVNVGYETGDDGMGNSPADLNAGASISIGDITLSGGMRDSNDDMGGESMQMDIGASMAMDALTLSAGWANTDTTNMYALGAAYPLGEGVQLDVQVDFGNNDMPDAAMGEEDEWVQFMVGTAINF